MLKRGSRGQTMIETAFFLPIVCLVLFGVIYVSNLGLINERVQIAIRYGALQGFGGTGTSYSVANIYTEGNANSQACTGPPPGILYNDTPYPGPTSAPYWQPAATPAPTSSCGPATKNIGGASFLMSRYVTYGSESITASPQVPAYLSSIVGSPQISASEAFVHPAWPAAILLCLQSTNQGVKAALTASGLITLPSGWISGNCPNT